MKSDNSKYFNKYMSYKMKYIKMKQQLKMNSSIKVMTWNVCWEALEGAVSSKLDRTSCKVDDINVCSNNIKKIIQEKINDLYDIICLQEINKKKWDELEIDAPYHTIIFNDIKQAGMITIISNKYLVTNEIKGNLVDISIDIRPYTILLLNSNIVLINVHFPHENSLQISAIENIKSQILLLINSETIFFICGDFNNNNPTMLPNFNFRINPNKHQINTCCAKNTNISYKSSYDHIYSNLKNIKYETLNTDDLTLYKSFISDHLPLFTEFL